MILETKKIMHTILENSYNAEKRPFHSWNYFRWSFLLWVFSLNSLNDTLQITSVHWRRFSIKCWSFNWFSRLDRIKGEKRVAEFTSPKSFWSNWLMFSFIWFVYFTSSHLSFLISFFFRMRSLLMLFFLSLLYYAVNSHPPHSCHSGLITDKNW